MTLGNFKPFLIGVGILAAAVAVTMGLGALKPENEKEESAKPPLVVRTASAEYKEQKVSAKFQGEVRAKTNIELVTQVTGKVMSVSDKFIEGGEFEAGETLLQIDDADYLVALESAKASVASAQVDLEVERATAETRAKEWKDLQGRPIEQANPLVLNKPQIDRAKARLDAAKAELSAAELNYERTKISAPFTGRIMTKSAELGQFMSRGASVGRVFATDAMEVRIPMTDVQISELGLRLGYSAGGSSELIPATISAIFGDTQHVWPGYVKSVDASVDAQTRLLFATVVVDEPFNDQSDFDMPLVPGLFVDVELASPNNLVGLELPRTALRNGNQVYAYHNDELKKKTVRVVYTSEDRVIVSLDGSQISVGESIITSSVPGAYEGMPIKLVASAQNVDNIVEAESVEAEPVIQPGESEEKDEVSETEAAQLGDGDTGALEQEAADTSEKVQS